MKGYREICHLWKGNLRGRRKKGRGRGKGETKGPNRWILWLYIVGKTFYFCDWFLFKWQYIDLKVQQLKGMQSYKQRMWKTLHFVNRRYTKGVPFSWEIACKRVRLELYAEPPRTKICVSPPPRKRRKRVATLFTACARFVFSHVEKISKKNLRDQVEECLRSSSLLCRWWHCKTENFISFDRCTLFLFFMRRFWNKNCNHQKYKQTAANEVL